jgi:hypothetical protein
MKGTPGKSAGKKGVAEMHHMSHVTPCNIAYAAVLVRSIVCWAMSMIMLADSCQARYVLNGQEEWSAEDGNFNAEDFFKNIVDLFKDPEWSDSTLQWWDW